MYFVDRNQIEKTLCYMEGLLQELDKHQFETSLEKYGLERITHMMIESILDVGNMMIDGFIMRDPGSFDDIIDILIDEEVLPIAESDNYKEIIHLRHDLVKNYIDIDHAKLVQVITKHHDSLENFSKRIRSYLSGETQGATAFYNH